MARIHQVGGDDDNRVIAGSGLDIFVYNPGDGNDKIYNFRTDTHHISGKDIIDLSVAGIRSYSELTITQVGIDTVINFPDGGSITLVNTPASVLDESYFVFTVDQTITGTDDAERLRGAGGDDTISGGGGGDILSGGIGDDRLFGGAGGDMIFGGAGDDVIEGGAERDMLYGNAGNDRLSGGAGDDFLSGGAGDDRLSGGDGDDTLYGLEGDDTLHGGAGDDRLYGDGLYGAGDGKDKLYGGDGDDKIAGGAGDDTVSGGAGDDSLFGGADADTFVFASGHGHDRIADFADGEDLIDLSAFTGITQFSDLNISQVGNNVEIDLSDETGGGSITLQNVLLADLDETAFVFYETPPDGG
ncbi:MAG: calcium-binding protein [Defluviicoccus sp.]|nr:calcium-binding protein [Defluviicoccus sp.]